MSLLRQLWLAIISLTFVVFIGSFLVSVLGARNYLEQQLSLKNGDNAASLALAISQLPSKDPVAVSLAVSAQFDTGHYQLIRLTAPDHRVLAEQRYQGDALETPAWFAALFPIRATPGVAQVQDGWRRVGTLTVVSHNRYAYRELWAGAIKLLAWFLAAGGLAGAIGSVVIRGIARPLNEMVDQARAIGERRFVTLAEPRTRELKSVVRAMNDLVGRLKRYFAEDAARLDELQRALNHDAVTGLLQRAPFMRQFETLLRTTDAPAIGALSLVRMVDLEALNRRLGHATTDRLLRRAASVLEGFCERHEQSVAARLNGSDFAVLLPGAEDPALLAAGIAGHLLQPLQNEWPEVQDFFHVGALAYHRDDVLAEILAAADQVLAEAETHGANAWWAATAPRLPQVRASTVWYGLLDGMLEKQRLKLAYFPVTRLDGRGLHEEGFLRLRAPDSDVWLVAGDFMPMAVRNRITAKLDLAALEFALASLRQSDGHIAINVCAESIIDWGFRNQVEHLLEQAGSLCPRLAIEIAEYGVFRALEAFRDFARGLKRTGCRVGMDHAGQRLNAWPDIADLGLDYVKIDHRFVRGAMVSPGDQDFLSGLCKMAHSMGIQVIAEGIREAGEQDALPALGFDGLTGPVLAERT